MSKKPEQLATDEAPGEFPIHAHAPLHVPKDFTIEALLERLDALEADVAELKGNQAVKKSSAKISG